MFASALTAMRSQRRPMPAFAERVARLQQGTVELGEHVDEPFRRVRLEVERRALEAQLDGMVGEQPLEMLLTAPAGRWRRVGGRLGQARPMMIQNRPM